MGNSEKHTSNVIQTDIPKSAHVDTYKHAHMNMKENRQWRKYLRSIDSWLKDFASQEMEIEIPVWNSRSLPEVEMGKPVRSFSPTPATVSTQCCITNLFLEFFHFPLSNMLHNAFVVLCSMKVWGLRQQQSVVLFPPSPHLRI